MVGDWVGDSGRRLQTGGWIDWRLGWPSRESRLDWRLSWRLETVTRKTRG
jgi:hypothetical protein